MAAELRFTRLPSDNPLLIDSRKTKLQLAAECCGASWVGAQGEAGQQAGARAGEAAWAGWVSDFRALGVILAKLPRLLKPR